MHSVNARDHGGGRHSAVSCNAVGGEVKQVQTGQQGRRKGKSCLMNPALQSLLVVGVAVVTTNDVAAQQYDLSFST